MKEKKQDESMEYQAGATLVDEGITFTVPIVDKIQRKFKIRPLKAGTIVKISQQVTKINQLQESDNMIQEMLEKGANLKPISKILAYAVLNNPVKIALFGRLLSHTLLWKVENMERLLANMTLAYRQMGAQHFFFIMALTKGMNFLEKKTIAESSAAVKPSGAQSQ
jgi:hypothetical protein